MINILSVRLETTLPVRDLLKHLYVLIPVLDNEKHYWIGDTEVREAATLWRGVAAVTPGERTYSATLPQASSEFGS
ncbi:MAG: hypothetical protein M2R45_05156 [Verrucomicrobia subdivision 3 bacterium]|nr:hypothetical protein [Limisphaerales bacterium]MCS1413799.1 hypothetical protein [Limisphaerales bacterium]